MRTSTRCNPGRSLRTVTTGPLRNLLNGLAPEEPLQEEIRPGGGLCYHSEADGTGGNTAASLVADLCADGSRLPVRHRNTLRPGCRFHCCTSTPLGNFGT